MHCAVQQICLFGQCKYGLFPYRGMCLHMCMYLMSVYYLIYLKLLYFFGRNSTLYKTAQNFSRIITVFVFQLAERKEFINLSLKTSCLTYQRKTPSSTSSGKREQSIMFAIQLISTENMRSKCFHLATCLISTIAEFIQFSGFSFHQQLY